MSELNLAHCHSQSLAIRDRILHRVHLGLQQLAFYRLLVPLDYRCYLTVDDKGASRAYQAAIVPLIDGKIPVGIANVLSVRENGGSNVKQCTPRH
jgi:hypothetical protein